MHAPSSVSPPPRLSRFDLHHLQIFMSIGSLSFSPCTRRYHYHHQRLLLQSSSLPASSSAAPSGQYSVSVFMYDHRHLQHWHCPHSHTSYVISANCHGCFRLSLISTTVITSIMIMIVMILWFIFRGFQARRGWWRHCPPVLARRWKSRVSAFAVQGLG